MCYNLPQMFILRHLFAGQGACEINCQVSIEGENAKKTTYIDVSKNVWKLMAGKKNILKVWMWKKGERCLWKLYWSSQWVCEVCRLMRLTAKGTLKK